MPQSKRKGDRDYSDCKFRSQLTNLPAGIQHMLDRALDSFGTDPVVLARWTKPVVLANGKTVLERDFFPHGSNKIDICCADGVALPHGPHTIGPSLKVTLHIVPLMPTARPTNFQGRTVTWVRLLRI